MENYIRRGIILFLTIMLQISCGGGKKDKKANASEPKLKEEHYEIGERVYKKYCLACHQADGSGVPGLYPPLTNTNWVNGNEERLISTVIHGLQGEIKVNGEIYNNVMPNHSYLSNEEVAYVLSYIRMNFGNNSRMISPEEVETVRKKSVKLVH